MPLTPSETRTRLQALGLHPSRKLGQNFLVDGNIVRKSLELAQLAPGDRVVEVGPGLGTLTQALLEAGARVWAVELDRGLARHLRDALVPNWSGQLQLLEADAVTEPIAGLPAQEAEAGFKVVANLPYAISSPWMDAILGGPLPSRLVLMLQREAAERFAARPGTGDWGPLAIRLQAAYAVEPGHRVSAACFFPRPEVESALLCLRLLERPRPFSPAARTLLRDLFTRRRKQIGGTVRALAPALAPTVLASFERSGIRPQERAEDVPLEAWLALDQALAAHAACPPGSASPT